MPPLFNWHHYLTGITSICSVSVLRELLTLVRFDHTWHIPLLKCSSCMELNLFQFTLLQLLVHDSHWFTPFRKGSSTCSNYVTLLPKLVKNFNICRHNVCEHIPMYGTWFINVIHITFGVRYSLNTNLNIILSISSIWLYAVTYLFQILPHLDGDIYWNCILMYINVFLLKSLQQCRIHRSIDDLI